MNKIESFRPLTNSGHILSANIQEVLPHLRQVIERVNSRAGSVGPPTRVGTNLFEGLRYLCCAVDGPFPTRFLLLGCNTSKTILFNNAWRSQGWFELAFMLTKHAEVEDFFFRLQPNTIRKIGQRMVGQYGAHQLICVGRGEIQRNLSLVNDAGRWVFSTEGIPYPFEDLSNYELSKKTDRFTAEIMEKYLGEMGLHPFRDDFYRVNVEQPAIGIEVAFTELRELARTNPTTLEDIRSTYGPFD